MILSGSSTSRDALVSSGFFPGAPYASTMATMSFRTITLDLTQPPNQLHRAPVSSMSFPLQLALSLAQKLSAFPPAVQIGHGPQAELHDGDHHRSNGGAAKSFFVSKSVEIAGMVLGPESIHLTKWGSVLDCLTFGFQKGRRTNATPDAMRPAGRHLRALQLAHP